MKSLLQTIVKEPLLHFLGLGFCLFLIYGAVNEETATDNPDQIIVDRGMILTFMQYRAKAFKADAFESRLNSMSVKQRQQLIDDYVQQETLYREAKALQLDKNDAVARGRLIQQMRYLTQSVITAGMRFSDEELQTYLSEHEDRYTESAMATFTHVFISTAKRDADEARLLADQQLEQLNQQQIPFHKAVGYGDRFLYHRNYVKKDAELIASHFSDELQKAVFSVSASDQIWRGPYRSPYGYHLVLVTQQIPEHKPALSEVKGRVAQDLMQQRRQEQLDKAIKLMVANYDVEISEDLTAPSISEGSK